MTDQRFITRIVLVVLCLAFLAGCYWKRSSFFLILDVNGDDQLSHPEWMRYYGTQQHEHGLAQCSRKDFYLADCDNDEKLNWKEYYDFRFKRKGICGQLKSYSGYENRSKLLAALEKVEAEFIGNYAENL